MKQAKESLDEAKALLEAGMDVGIVLTNLYYAFYYPVLAVLYEGKVPETMQSVTLGLFDQQFVKTGIFKREHADAIREVFDIKPKCSGGEVCATGEVIRRLMAQAQGFIAEAEAYLRQKG
jgi:uncharacterized protein (UPF0332 family)